MAEAKLYVLQSVCELPLQCIKTTRHARAGQCLKEPSIFEGDEVRDDDRDQNLYRARTDSLNSWELGLVRTSTVDAIRSRRTSASNE